MYGHNLNTEDRRSVLCSALRLNMTHRQLMKDNENLQLDHKNMKTQLNGAKLEQTKLEAEFSKLKEQYQQLDITSTKLTNQCEVRTPLLVQIAQKTVEDWCSPFTFCLCVSS